jgi:hypothetical protein
MPGARAPGILPAPVVVLPKTDPAPNERPKVQTMTTFAVQIDVTLSAHDREDADQVVGAALKAAMDAVALQEAKGTGWSTTFKIADFDQLDE